MVKQTIDFSKIPESDVIVNEIWRRYKKGLGSNILVIGLSGTGKSSTSIREGELTQQKFLEEDIIINMYIVSSLLQFIEIVRKSKLGDIIIIEEVSVLFPSRRAMAKENVSINKIFDTVRKKQLVIISNAPILNSIDSHMRSMAHIIIETLKIYKTQKVVVSKTLRMQTNPRSGKTYFHRFQRKGRDVHRIFTRMPNGNIWQEYENNKDKFLDKLYDILKFEQETKEKKLNKDMNKDAEREAKARPTTAELRAHHLVRIEGKTLRETAKLMGYKSHVTINNLLIKLDQKTKISNIKNDGNDHTTHATN